MIRSTNTFFLLSVLAVGTANADTVPLWGPHVDIEAKPGSKRNLGEADLFLPLSQDARTLVFGSLRTRFDNKSSYEGNFGLGIRQMQERGWNLGAYGYWDHRRSPNHNFFDQATLGVEALGQDFDFRANGYVPVGTKAYALSPESTAAVSGASVQVATAFREERALKGFDMEAGWRLPIFDSEGARQLRLYAGGYRFADAGVKVEGPRLRAELTVDELPWFGKGTKLFLGAEGQHDNARGGQSFLSVRLRIPLGKETSVSRPLTAQERRMTAPVMRDVDVVTQNRVTSTLNETATTVGGQAITVLNSSTTTGAALPGAVAAAGANSTVILSGTFSTSAVTTVQAGQTLMGAGNLTVTTPSGHIATFAAPGGTIDRSGTPAGASVVAMSNNSSLIGMTVSGTSAGAGGYAIDAQSKTGVTLRNNTLTSSFTSGYTVDLMSSTDAVVTGNTITATASAGGAQDIRVSSAANILISGNTLTATGTPGYVVTGNNFTSFASGSTGNVATSGTCNFSAAPTGSVGFSSISCP